MCEIIRINKNDTNFKAASFVLKARQGDCSSRYSLELVKVEKGTMMATDGYRLHCAPVEKIDDGLYEIVRQTPTTIWLHAAKSTSWPDTKNILQIHDTLSGVKPPHLLGTNGKKKGKGESSIESEILIEAYRGGPIINYKYILALRGVQFDEVIYGDEKTPTVFRCEDGYKAVIMPFSPSQKLYSSPAC